MTPGFGARGLRFKSLSKPVLFRNSIFTHGQNNFPNKLHEFEKVCVKNLPLNKKFLLHISHEFLKMCVKKLPLDKKVLAH